ncbi:MAG: hypothetical protein LW629_01800 [Burkholderiales bacterium]|jgi:hypothetical protein|nr:hypothetical protein [Burkholderiales bacterium]
MTRLRRPLLIALLALSSACARAELYLLSKVELSGMTERIAERIYTGKQLDYNNKSLTPLNYTPENPVRQRFLGTVIGKTDAEYVAYWATRRYVGLGTPPEEVRDRLKMLNLISSREGALGYIEASSEEMVELRKKYSVLLIRNAETAAK